MLKLYAMIALAVMIFGGGWQSRSWYEDSKDLAIQKATDKALKIFADKESEVAILVSNKLRELRANERIIEHHTQEIIERPVYSNICIDDDGLFIINNSYAHRDPAIIVDEMRGITATITGKKREGRATDGEELVSTIP